MKYLIPKDRLESLNEKLKKISSKASKYNSSFTFKVLGERLVKKGNEVFSGVEVELQGVVKQTGWEYIGKLVREVEGDFNVIEKVQDIEVPERFLREPLRCDHCGKDIYRKYTYLVYNGSEFRQVGRTCLKDYTGIDLEYLGYLMTLEKTVEKSWSGLRPEKTIDTLGFLRVVSEVCRKNNGLYVREPSEEFRFPTVQTALCCYYVLTDDYKSRQFSKNIKRMAMDLDVNNPETVRIVNEIRETVTDPNFKNAIDFNVFPVSFASYLCELVFKYYTDVNDLEVKGLYFGNEGDKFDLEVSDFKLEMTFERTLNGYVSYTTYLYSFRYGEYKFKWFSSNEFKNAEKVRIKGTVKSHQEYKKHRETIVTRCKVFYDL